MFNERLVHKECMEEKKRIWQQNNKDTVLYKGMFVKKLFTEGDETEHMWVRLTSINGNELEGTLDNDPLLFKNIKFGDVISFNRDEIEEHID